MKILSSFKGMQIVTEEGMLLGHLADLRADARAKPTESSATSRIGTLVYGRAGWLEHMGLRSASQQTIEWRDVVRIEGDRLIVRNRTPQKGRRHGQAQTRRTKQRKSPR